ncbi:hypothetical protein SAY87_019179 [Trapa incisa]|uniref:RING-type domain-containing protein n=1 Tax=Trapa incisa TaxID=236973 RepID=A0AAN7Q217_9MYRT|nr:hypothetical protein SAY87_019179 [Trapa incisa]
MTVFLMEDSSSSCFLLYKAALAFALIRCVLSWAFRLRRRRRRSPPPPSSSAAHLKVSPQMITQSLGVTTYGDVTWRRRHPACCGGDTCAVCLAQLEEADEVRELRNCRHVFHRECIDRWVDHDCCDDEDADASDNHQSCPLCRAPLLTPSQGYDRWGQRTESEPSWAVERIIYLFGDDLICC